MPESRPVPTVTAWTCSRPIRLRAVWSAALRAILAVVLLAASPPAFDPAPWLADAAQLKAAFGTRYANLAWLRHEREVDVDALFARLDLRLGSASSEAEARDAFERFVRRVNDGHVELSWPQPVGAAPVPASAPSLCERRGFDAREASAGLAYRLPGYTPLGTQGLLPAGIIPVGGRRLGVVRLGVFQPQGYPALCEAATRALGLSPDAPCDDACGDRLDRLATQRLTDAFADRLRALRQAGATVLLLDLTNNGGGSEWAEVAARMLTSRRLVAEPLGFVRTPAWSRRWRDLARDLRMAEAAASPADRARLAAWRVQAERAAAAAATSCSQPGCALPRAGNATGLVASAAAGAFAGKPWGSLVFSPAAERYDDGVWSGPLILLVNGETWSAAEEVAAELQDNHAAIVLGARTGGAGCGHASGAGPLLLEHSGAQITLPDCARFRADGSNEVSGIVPDVPVAIRSDDGPAFATRMVAAALPEAIRRAEQLHGEARATR